MHGTKPYPNAPLVLAIVEVRHPTTAALDSPALMAAKEMLAEFTPLSRVEERNEIDLGTGTQRPVLLPKLIARDKQTSVTFGAEAIVVETTAYPGWQAFRKVLAAALDARQTVAPLDGFERIGLRYIDEIRVPTFDQEIDWSDWVISDLLGPRRRFADLGLSQLQQQGISTYATARPGESYSLRYGAIVGAPAVTSGPNLVRHNTPKPGPFFLLDTDGSWNLEPSSAIPEYDPNRIMEIADRIHRPIKELFELSITDRLRKEVLEVAN
ncbi:TIGR04255 family protein [Cellulomonas xiejunii]|uniref:TIGR04255 family protein n=1 Tax=Cellulomonas xiejunii TaxID=2968083 RepID=A0ABY5KLE0_9CELL|nr:TIGR04255 family protein [Cellulomonas xiejunii]MCC2319733.1 TIGR04255 family protein [Cellulomonas xiejunii]UUI71329.1 TIGR04255 family protein [Cellulomonas xiejunii]